MRQCVFPLLLVLVALVACSSPSSEPHPPEAPIQPLVIGTSPSVPIAASPDEPIAAEEPGAVHSTTLAVPARDPRLSKGTRRSQALVTTEVKALDQLFASTPKGSPDRPALARRLADDYAELARMSDGPAAAAANKKALEQYELITVEYPKSPQIDEALYYLALHHEMSGSFVGARRAYFELIKRAPQSKLVPLAYFAFAELFFEEGATDPSKNQLAEQAYREVLKYPPAQNAVYVEAQHRLSELRLR